MRRKIESENRKLKSSSSHEKTPKYRSQFPAWQFDKQVATKSPKYRNLISRDEPNESFDTCIFPSNLIPDYPTQSSTTTQTDLFLNPQDSLQQENFFLKSEILSLKSEISSLKSFIKQASLYKTLAKLKANENIIEMLQNENNLIKKSLESE